MMKLLSSNNTEYISLPNPKGKTHSNCILSACQPGRTVQDKDLLLVVGGDTGSMGGRNIAIIWVFSINLLEPAYEKDFLLWNAPMVRQQPWCLHRHSTPIFAAPLSITADMYRQLYTDHTLWHFWHLSSLWSCRACRKQNRDYSNNGAYNHAHRQTNHMVERGPLPISNQSAKLSH